jgi:hypothetical protein
MSGHDAHEHHAAPAEDHSITVKVGIFFVLVVISLFIIAKIN